MPQRTTVGLVGIATAAFVALALGIGDTPGHDGRPTEPPAPAACGQYTDGDTPGNTIPGVCYQDVTIDGYPTIDTADYGTDIPRCAEDDYNATALPRCYTERPGAVIVIDATDTVIATLD